MQFNEKKVIMQIKIVHHLHMLICTVYYRYSALFRFKLCTKLNFAINRTLNTYEYGEKNYLHYNVFFIMSTFTITKLYSTKLSARIDPATEY